MNIWYFGDYAGLDFNVPPATPAGPAEVTTSAMTAAEGVASQCDPATGQLLFYTNGIHVFDRNNSPMPNSDGIDSLGGGFSSTQAAVSVHDPGDPNRYYLFTTPNFGESIAEYNIIDMSQRGGLGDVTVRRQALPTLGGVAPPDQVSEKIAATRDAAGTGYWIVLREFPVIGNTTNRLFAYHLSAGGIDRVRLSSGGVAISGIGDFAIGEMKISPDGKWLAAAYETRVTDLFTFDNATGALTFVVTLPETYGLSFSPNSLLLYINSGQISVLAPITQYSLADPSPAAITASATVIGRSVNEALGSMQIAPDGRIYVAKNGGNSLGVINSPDVAGVGCGYVNTGFTFTGDRKCFLGLPNFLLEPLVPVEPRTKYTGSDTVICAGSSISIGLPALEGYTYAWSPATGLSCTDCSNPIAAPSGSTIYHLIATDVVGNRHLDSIIVQVDTLFKGGAARIDRGYHIKPGNGISVPLVLDGSIGAPLIDTVTVTLGYRRSILRLSSVSAGTLLQGWSLDTLQRGDSTITFRLVAPAGTYLSGSGPLVELRFLAFLGDTIESELPVTVDLSGPQGYPCTAIATSPGLITLDSVCGIDLRLIEGSASKYALSQNSPNPFNPATDIRFSLGLDGHTTLAIYNESGERVSTLLSGQLPPGVYTAHWDAGTMPSGLYYYRLSSGAWSGVGRMVLRR